MRLTFGYQIAPGCCHVCRSAKPCKIIDTSRDDPDTIKRQAVYLCEWCVTAAYQMLDPTKVLIEQQVLADKDGEIIALTNEVTRLMDEASALDIRLAKAVASQATV